MIGFEIEIDLPVTNAQGGTIPGDTDLARSTTAPGFKIVSDSRTLTTGAGYSNLEFVSDAVSAIGTQQVAGRATILGQRAEMLRIRNVLYVAGAAALAGRDPQLNTVGVGANALLNPNLPYNETNLLLVHYSVGVPLAGLPQFFDRLRAAAPILPLAQGNSPATIRDRFSLHQARAFAAAELAVFLHQPGAPAAGSQRARALDGFLQLGYMQVCALADHLDYAANQRGNIKNLTAVLCRSAFIDVFPLLSGQAQNFLIARCGGTEPLITNLAAHQQVAEQGFGQNHDFHEDGQRQSGNLAMITLMDFTLSVFTGNQRVNPQRVFGGMRDIAPHAEQNVNVVPMELRSVGNESKSWMDVQNELTSLCAWAHEAYGLA